MEDKFMIVYKGGSGEIVEKKSRFIAKVVPVKTEGEALQWLESVRKEYWDAKHHCFAYVIGERDECARCSDDGEPAQTAGKPMMDMLLGEQLHYVAAVVTRYFGGTLLGTGGLVRAYGGALREGLSHCVITQRLSCIRLRVTCDYNALGKSQYEAAKLGIPASEEAYTDVVSMTWIAQDQQKDRFIKKLLEVTSGRVKIEEVGRCFAVLQEGKLQVL